MSYYKVLGLSRVASSADVRLAYQAAVKRTHPDTGKQTASVGNFQKVHDAYRTLADPKRRAAYDEQQFGIKRNAGRHESHRSKDESRKSSNRAWKYESDYSSGRPEASEWMGAGQRYKPDDVPRGGPGGPWSSSPFGPASVEDLKKTLRFWYFMPMGEFVQRFQVHWNLLVSHARRPWPKDWITYRSGVGFVPWRWQTSWTRRFTTHNYAQQREIFEILSRGKRRAQSIGSQGLARVIICAVLVVGLGISRNFTQWQAHRCVPVPEAPSYVEVCTADGASINKMPRVSEQEQLLLIDELHRRRSSGIEFGEDEMIGLISKHRRNLAARE